jgi:hypothetical protein
MTFKMICLFGFLLTFIGCAPISETILSPGSEIELQACYAIFPTGPWESVHKIEATFRRGGSFTLLGVTKGNPSEQNLESVLLTPEGFILFEAEYKKNGMTVRKSVPPFDSPAFAKGLMEDVTFLFLSPGTDPITWGRKGDGMLICNWEGPNGINTEITGSVGNGWKILRRNKEKKIIKEVTLDGPFINGLATRIEIRAFTPLSYKIRMTLLQTPS